jgi:hypothetical protein
VPSSAEYRIFFTGGKKTKVGSASNQLDTVEMWNPVTSNTWTTLPSLINKRKLLPDSSFKPWRSKKIEYFGRVVDPYPAY